MPVVKKDPAILRNSMMSIASRNKIRVDQILPSPTNSRRACKQEGEEWEQFLQSIRQGMIEPILVRRMPDANTVNRYQLIAGERRWLAHKALGLTEISAEIKDVDDLGALTMQITENVQRSDYEPLELAEKLSWLRTEHGLNNQQIAEKTGINHQRVSELLSLQRLIAPFKGLLEANKLSLSHCLKLSPLPAEHQEQASLILFENVEATNSEEVAKIVLDPEYKGRPITEYRLRDWLYDLRGRRTAQATTPVNTLSDSDPQLISGTRNTELLANNNRSREIKKTISERNVPNQTRKEPALASPETTSKLEERRKLIEEALSKKFDFAIVLETVVRQAGRVIVRSDFNNGSWQRIYKWMGWKESNNLTPEEVQLHLSTLDFETLARTMLVAQLEQSLSILERDSKGNSNDFEVIFDTLTRRDREESIPAQLNESEALATA